MPTSKAATAVAPERFRMSAALGSLRVECDLPGVERTARESASPLFAFEPLGEAPERPNDITVRVRVVRALDLPADLERHRAETPSLDLDASSFVIVDYGRRYLLLQPAAADGAAMTVRGERGGRLVQLDVVGRSAAARRAVARFLRFALAAQLTGAGLPALHGSAVARDDRAVLVLGPRGSGKSSLMLMATTRAGWDFVSDDVLLPYRDPAAGTLRVTGLPKRIGVSIGALDGHPARARFESMALRYHGGAPGPLSPDPAAPWGAAHRVRLYCELAEFLTVTGAAAVASARPVGVLLPEARRELRGWRVEPATRAADWVAANRASTRQLKYVTDFLGLLPATVPAGCADVHADLAGLPVVRVAYGADVNRDFARFWTEVTDAFTACPAPDLAPAMNGADR